MPVTAEAAELRSLAGAPLRVPETPTTATTPFASPRFVALTLLLLGLLMAASNPYFTFIEDEVLIITSAASPAATTVNLFLHGTGQHEHPPLYDLLLHGWLRIAGNHLWMLRLPSIAFYLAGIWALVEAARRLGGSRAASMALCIGVAWPFGFHFGRLAAWYSLSFLLVAILTLKYLDFLRARTVGNWLGMTLAAVLLLYTSYFGWAIFACLLLDYLLQTRRELDKSWWPVWSTLLVATIGFLPLGRAFAAELHRAPGIKGSLAGSALFEAFNIYSVFASESVAPWHWWLAAPVLIAIGICTAAILVCGPAVARRLYFGFLMLVTAMCALGILGTKRLLLISPWAVLAVALCAATIQSRRWRIALFTSLAVIAAVGWFGIITRQDYAAPRFIEPWQDVAGRMAQAVRNGGVVIGDHPSLFFYLTFALSPQAPLDSLDRAMLWSNPKYSRQVYVPFTWLEHANRVGGDVFLVKAVSSGPAAYAAERDLQQRCALQGTDRLLPDTGFDLKRSFLPSFPRVRYRIEIDHYLCPNAAAL